MREPANCDSNCVLHQLISSRTVALGVRLLNQGFPSKEDVNQERAGRRERPSGIAREQ